MRTILASFALMLDHRLLGPNLGERAVTYGPITKPPTQFGTRLARKASRAIDTIGPPSRAVSTARTITQANSG